MLDVTSIPFPTLPLAQAGIGGIKGGTASFQSDLNQAFQGVGRSAGDEAFAGKMGVGTSARLETPWHAGGGAPIHTSEGAGRATWLPFSDDSLSGVTTDSYLQPGPAPGLASLSNAEMNWLAEGFQQLAMAQGSGAMGGVKTQVGVLPGKAPGLAALSRSEQAFLNAEFRASAAARGQKAHPEQGSTVQPLGQNPDPATLAPVSGNQIGAALQ
ncbi:MAG: hypothetical protein HQL62_09920, partial [Magnetococcales bacterium]|nr:hypothetical protein [Magnetococcales bacterium]